MGQCPSSFDPYQGACIRKCPQDAQFLLTLDNNQPRCSYKGDPKKYIDLYPVPSILLEPGNPMPTLAALERTDPERYNAFKTESDRVDRMFTSLMADIDKQTKIDTAFKDLQTAENTRDTSPEAYTRARVAYYSMIKGPEWAETEKERITKAEVEPELDRYRGAIKSLQEKQSTLQKTKDVVQSVKSGVLSLKDDFQYTTKTFKAQIDNLKNQINLERRDREKPAGEGTGFFKWIDLILNVLIVAGLIYAGLVVWQKYSVEKDTNMIRLRLSPT
jgi:hypothetical protein